MPNYCEGTLRVRGTYKNLKRFVEETLEGVQLLEEVVPTSDPFTCLRFKYDQKENEWGYHMNDSCNYGRAAFAKLSDRYFYGSCIASDCYVIYFDMLQGWTVEGAYVVDLAQYYGVDMAIDAYEHGVGVEVHVKVVNGKVIENSYTEFHEDWFFDVPIPSAGW